ncbi:lipoprotein [Pantoea stewartii]|uniref:lipoprotein n=1 Tax=Pantoea stewartii TaxID=66269 RepID=UPI00249F81A2|nr:lipoprotein [Pantoea stewartii]
MRNKGFALLLPAALLLSACTTVEPVIKDNGPRMAPCVEGGPDTVAQRFYDMRIEHPSSGLPDTATLAQYRPYLSDELYQALLQASQRPDAATWRNGDLFSSLAQGPTGVDVADASTIPNRDARNIPLRVKMSRGDKQWQDEVLMIHQGSCWVVDDVRYVADVPHPGGGSLSQLLEKTQK